MIYANCSGFFFLTIKKLVNSLYQFPTKCEHGTGYLHNFVLFFHYFFKSEFLT